MRKKVSIFGLLLVLLLVVTTPYVYAASSITAKKFRSVLEDLGYEVDDYDSDDYAYAKKDDISITYRKYDSESEAKEELASVCEEIDKYKESGVLKLDTYSKKNCSESTSSSKGYVKYAGSTSFGGSGYSIVYRIGDTIVSADGNKDDSKEINKAMKKLGYYSSSSLGIVIVVIVIGVGVAVFFIMKNKKKNQMPYNNNGMMYNQQPMMNNGMNGYPQQPMPNQNMNQMNFGMPNQQGMNNMNQPMPNQGAFNQQQQDFWSQPNPNNNMFNDSNPNNK